MTQPTANEQLSAYLDGELADSERDELEKALAEDPALRQELARLEKAVSFLKMHGPVQAPRGFQEKVLAKVANESMPGWWWRWVRRPFGLPVEGLAVALAAAMVLLIALPFGLRTASQTGKDLASDPYGFVRSDEALKGASRSETAAAPPPPPAADKLGEEEGEAVADLEADLGDDEPADAVLGKSELRSRPAPAPLSGPSVGTAQNADNSTAAPDAAAPTSTSGYGGGDVQAAVAPGVLLKYDILTYDEDALAQLQRIASKYRGSVTDTSGAASKTIDLQSGQTYLVEIPSSALAAFGDDLHELGMVTEAVDPRKWAGDSVRVQVTFQVMPSPSGTRALKAAPSTDQPASTEQGH